MSIRVVFLGNDAWSVPALRALARSEDIRVELVGTNPARPAGRGSQITATAVAQAAASLKLPTFETARVGSIESRQLLLGASPDVLVVVAYGELLSPEVLAIPAWGSVNLHFSLLPRWRGASPVQRAILAGDRSTGVSAMLIDEGLDTGPILIAEEVEIEPGEDAGTLGLRLAEIGAPLLVSAVRSLVEGISTSRPQDDSLATAAPKLSKEDRIIDWDETAAAVVCRVRALSPEPGAQTSIAGRILKVFTADVSALDHATTGDSNTFLPGRILPGTILPGTILPGTILEVSRDSIEVAAVGSSVRIADVAEAGRKRMSAGAWARGSRVSAGARLG
jgi:methionyl-tRNA formyltransferase